MAEPQQYSLKWNNYLRQLTYALDSHRVNDEFVDCSLLCDGGKIKAHKVVLSSCSSYFKEIFTENPHPHPIIIFKFIKFEDLQSIIKFMYQGEVNVEQEGLQSFLQTAKLLAVHGLGSDNNDDPMGSVCEQTSSCKVPEQNIDLQKSNSGHSKSTSSIQTSTSTTAKTVQSAAPSCSKESTAKKRKITYSDTNDDDDSVCTLESLRKETLQESDNRNDNTEPLKVDMPEYILGAAEEHHTQTDNNQDKSSDIIQPNITEIKTESEIFDSSELDDKYQTFDDAEMTIESRRLFNPSSYSFLTPLDETASCSNTAATGQKGNSSVKQLCHSCKELSEEFNSYKDTAQKRYNTLIDILTEHKILLDKTVIQSSTNVMGVFPIDSEEKLKELDDILAIHADSYIQQIKSLLGGNAERNLHQIFGHEVILNFNVDGSFGKKRLRDYGNVFTAIIDAISSFSESSDKTLRAAFQRQKKRIFKQKNRSKFKNNAQDENDGDSSGKE